MAQITNKYDLPSVLLRAIERDPYTRGEARFSVTQLIDAPQIRALRRQHAKLMQRDVAEMVWALMGKAIHTILEEGAAKENDPNIVVEERIATVVNGVLVSGAMDVQDEGGKIEIRDWKTTSVYAVMYGRDSWEKQLNLYAALRRREKGGKVDKLTIIAIMRDWRKRDADKNPDYPEAPIMAIPVEVWPPGEAEEYLAERVKFHADTDTSLEWDEPLPECTDEERWWREGKWLVERKAKPTKAKPEPDFYVWRVFDTEEEARKLMADSVGELRIGRRRSPPVRCQEDYCGVAEWCQQWARDKPKEKEASEEGSPEAP